MAVVNPFTWGLGRRKSSVARVRIKPGSGAFLINGKPYAEFFPVLQQQVSVTAPLRATEQSEAFDVFCNVYGGGTTGQSGAVSLGLARALAKQNPTFDPLLREEGLMTRDARMKERKKYGRRGARRGFQFSKR